MFLRSKIQLMMIRKRSRSIGNNKQGISTIDTNKPNSPLLNYPRLILGLSPKAGNSTACPETEHVTISPTSTLEPRPFSKLTNPTLAWAQPSPSGTIARETGTNNQKPIGLGLIDVLKDEEMDNSSSSCQDTRMVLFGSKLKIQVPPPLSPTGHHIEFGIKNKSSQLALCSLIDRTPIGSNGCLSPRDLELLSEDYTCIISHGPNPRTTHIFDNRIVESPGAEGLMNMLPLRCDSSDRYSSSGDQSGRKSGDFLSFCHGCNKDIIPGSDVFMYRGESAFCSTECRYRTMLFDEAND